MKLRWIWNELRRNISISLLFILNVSVGLTGYMLVDSYKTSISQFIHENRRELLAADFIVAARRELEHAEAEFVEGLSAKHTNSVSYDFFVMASVNGRSRLVLAKAIDSNYPLYGELIVDGESGRRIDDGLWLSREAVEALQAGVGDTLKLGEARLPVTGVVSDDSTTTLRAFGVAPRVYFSRENLPKTGLLQFGSTFTKVHSFKIDDPAEITRVHAEALARMPDPALNIETADSSARDSNRQLGYLSDFLGLAAIISLILAAIGSAYTWRLFIQRKLVNIAILRSLGVTSSEVVRLYVIMAVILGAFAILPAAGLAQVALPLFQHIISSFTSIPIEPVVAPLSLVSAFFLTLLFSLFVSLPTLARIKEHNPSSLFMESRLEPALRAAGIWSYLLPAAAVWMMAVLQSNSLKTATIFMASVVGAFLVLAACGWLILRSLGVFAHSKWFVRQGILSVQRRPFSALAVFVSIGLGSLLITLLPQIRATLLSELSTPSDSKVPSLFLFDIQDEQLDPLKSFLKDNDVSIVGLSPLIRARILSVNGAKYEREIKEGEFVTREEQQEARFRNRGINLSYRTELSPSEEILQGKPFDPRDPDDLDSPAQLSVEFRYADRMGFKLGDKVVFDVQGVEFTGQVINLRRVNWTSFQPNFFILFQPGVLDEAPKTWLAGVGGVAEDRKNPLQFELAKKFANVSAVDIKKTVEELLRIAEQMSGALWLISILAIFTGLAVLFTIAQTQVLQRRNELTLLKVLGARSSGVIGYLTVEFGLLTLIGSALGVVLSLVGGYIFSIYIFDHMPEYDLAAGAWVVFVVVSAGVGLSAAVAWRVVTRSRAEI